MTKFLPEEIDEIAEYTGLSPAIRRHFAPPYVQFFTEPTAEDGRITLFLDALPHEKQQQYINNFEETFYTTPKTDEKYRKYRTKIECIGTFLTHIVVETPNTLCEIRVFNLEKQILFSEKFTNEFTFPYAANTKTTEIILLTSNFTRFECETFDFDATDFTNLLTSITFVPNEMLSVLDIAEEYREKSRSELASMNATKIRNHEKLCAFSERNTNFISEDDLVTIGNEDILNEILISSFGTNCVEFYGLTFAVHKNVDLSIKFIRPVNLQRGDNITIKMNKFCACAYDHTAVPGFELPLPGETIWSDD